MNCVLALHAYSEWKKAGGHGTFKYDGTPKPCPTRKQIVHNSLDMEKCCNLWKNVEDKVSSMLSYYKKILCNKWNHLMINWEWFLYFLASSYACSWSSDGSEARRYSCGEFSYSLVEMFYFNHFISLRKYLFADCWDCVKQTHRGFWKKIGYSQRKGKQSTCPKCVEKCIIDWVVPS